MTDLQTAPATGAEASADALTVEHLSAGYGTTTILRDVSLRVAAYTVGVQRVTEAIKMRGY